MWYDKLASACGIVLTHTAFPLVFWCRAHTWQKPCFCLQQQHRVSRYIYVRSPNYIKKGKTPGGLKGLTLSGDQVAIWVESYLICAYVTLAIESMYSADQELKEEKRKEEWQKWRILTGIMFTKSCWNIPILSKRQCQASVTPLMAKCRMRLSTSRKPSS